jgi:hemoglobin
MAGLVLAVFLVGCGGAQESATPAKEATPQAPQKSLYERLGGVDAITAVTDAFIGKAAADTRINAKLAKSDVPRLRFHLIEQLCAATGGPCDYTGRDMPSVHKDLGITDGEFEALVEDLVAALDQFKVPEAEKSELLGILGPLRSQIVTVPGRATGTPLPPSFQPAPALSAEKIQGGPTRK